MAGEFEKEPESTRARLTLDDLRKAREQAASEPTFTYDASKPLPDDQKHALAEAQRNPPPITRVDAPLRRYSLEEIRAATAGEHAATQAALVSEAKAHQWEHKQPSATGVAAGTYAPERIFTRTQVLTVLETYRALGSTRQRDDVNDLIAIFSGMR